MKAILLTLALSNPITRFYDVSDLVSPPPQFKNAPRFSLPAGIVGSIPVLAVDEDVIRFSNKRKLENIILDTAFHIGDYDATILWWRDTMIIKGSRELHRSIR